MKTQMGNIAPRVDCPWCGRSVAVIRGSERLFSHQTQRGMAECFGSRKPVDLYGMSEVLP